MARFPLLDTVINTVKNWTLSIHAGFRAILKKRPFANVRLLSERRPNFDGRNCHTASKIGVTVSLNPGISDTVRTVFFNSNTVPWPAA